MKIVQVLVLGDEYHYWPVSCWSDRAKALASARTHKIDWLLVEYPVDADSKGTCIWSSHADAGGEERSSYRQFWDSMPPNQQG